MTRTIAIIDLKSFYASCECAVRHLDIFKTPLVCCDPYRSDSSIVMSVTPYLKEKYGCGNVCRKRDLPNVPGMIYAVPRMSYYLTISAKVVSIFLEYVAPEDLHIYSVDESFLNLGPYLKLYGGSAETIVKRIQKEIWDRLGLVATAGIGPNMFLAKTALDNEGKKKKPFIAHWDEQDVPAKLWKIHPMTKIWSIAEGTASHLSRIGINTLKELAHADDTLLAKEFGIMGAQLKALANGKDESEIPQKYTPVSPSLSNGQTLIKPLVPSQCELLLREMVDDLSSRLRKESFLTQKISVWASYGTLGGYSRQMQLPIATDSTYELFAYIREAFFSGIKEAQICALGISFGKLSNPKMEQTSLFIDPKEQEERRSLDRTLDQIHGIYGRNSVLRCSSLLPNSTIRRRHEQIGGHRE